MKSKNIYYKGSLLASTIVLTFMYVTTLTFIFHRYDVQQELISVSIKRSRIETLVNLATFYLEHTEEKQSGELVYSTGVIHYTYEATGHYLLEVKLVTGESIKRSITTIK
ncbi:hypothetical protein [Vagococcus xieshaowenii]|uniref:Uncharacterized protein n=1 Tax=Vagococcus xieshaowenii TaxID=2562451 RepID=A0AAJ5JKS9_9ENTE|nr:hypothetical protein [Vagococcus xieshaowenii]QCA28098.1 hypothetical protein E4Z98_01765 [Vagococcus xieshaowenii]TFZ40141.1 hypothetical protein E4031_08090 [Vagococcus xieshaowenii]